MTKLLAFGDVHIGSGSQYPGRLRDHERVLEQIFQLARDRNVDGILFAGDLFEGPEITPDQIDAFMRPFEQLRGEIPMLAIPGNSKHDLAMRDVNALAPLRHLPGITIASQHGMYLFAGCAVYTLPWVHPGRLIARAGRDVARDEINVIASSLLVDTARDLLADYPSGDPKILLGHWHADYALNAHGGNITEFLHEPCLPYAEIEALEFDHVVLGHNHRAQSLGVNGFHPGSPLCLNFGEEHLSHGVTILHVGESEEIDFPGAEYLEIDSAPFLTFDTDRDGSIEAILADHDLADAIVRVRYTATAAEQRHIDGAAIRSLLLEAGARFVKIEPRIEREQRARVQGVDERLDEVAALEMWLAANSIDEGTATEMRAKTREYLAATR